MENSPVGAKIHKFGAQTHMLDAETHKASAETHKASAETHKVGERNTGWPRVELAHLIVCEAADGLIGDKFRKQCTKSVNDILQEV